MNILVTGVSGFVGSALAQRLSQSHKVTGLVRNKLKRSIDPKITIVKGDLSNVASLNKALKGIDVVFHCAAALPYHNLLDADYFKINVEGTRNVILAAKKNKVKRLVHISTVGIYDPISSAYSRSKQQAEELIKQTGSGLETVIVRPTIAYGPGDLRPGFLDLFRLIQKNILVTIADGSNHFHTIYIDNLVDALVYCLKSKKVVNKDFIIGDYPCPRMIDIMKAMAKAMNKKPLHIKLPKPIAYLAGFFFDLGKNFGIPQILNTRRVHFLSDVRIYSINKAVDTFNYTPKISLNEGIKQTLEWYQKEGYLR